MRKIYYVFFKGAQKLKIYGELAKVYENFNHDREEYSDYVLEVLKEHCVLPPAEVCDVACGTGNAAIKLAMAGYFVTAVDKSAEMLSAAAEKAYNAKQSIRFFEMDMLEFVLPRKVEAVNCSIDAVNYLNNDETRQFFGRVYNALLPGGRFFFDISTGHYLKNVLGTGQFSETDEQSAYICETELEGESLGMKVTIFTGKDGIYQRSEEYHKLYIHEVEKLKRNLTIAGFGEIAVYDFLTFNKLHESSIRAQFAARKR